MLCTSILKIKKNYHNVNMKTLHECTTKILSGMLKLRNLFSFSFRKTQNALSMGFLKWTQLNPFLTHTVGNNKWCTCCNKNYTMIATSTDKIK